jgi:hypothetical protein
MADRAFPGRPSMDDLAPIRELWTGVDREICRLASTHSLKGLKRRFSNLSLS